MRGPRAAGDRGAERAGRVEAAPGQRPGDQRAGYVLLDVGTEETQVEFVRVPYDVESAARGVIAAGLPEEFAEFLRTGGKPTPVATA